MMIAEEMRFFESFLQSSFFPCYTIEEHKLSPNYNHSGLMQITNRNRIERRELQQLPT